MTCHPTPATRASQPGPSNRSRRRRRRRTGFTLVEILIVVIILGILAAIVIPQFAGATEEARRTNVQSVLQTLRGEITLYRAEHRDILPDLTNAGWNPLLAPTDIDGNPAAAGKTYGPYMRSMPKNPLNNMSTIGDGTGGAPVGAAVGYVYDYSGGNGTGRIYATEADGTTIFVER